MNMGCVPMGIAVAALNLVVFLLYGYDKFCARHGRWRLRERSLLCAAAVGPAGALLAMELFRHKTRKARFRIVVPALCLLHAVGFYFVVMRL